MAEAEEKSTAGAWAAAAIVLALGALAFGVTSHLRVNDLEARLDALESSTTTALDGSAPVPPVPAESNGAPASTIGSSSEPPDPDGARTDVADAFGTLYDGSRPTPERLAVVDDPEGVGRALAVVESGPLGELASEVSVSIDDVSFTSDTRAIVSYTLTFGGLADVAPRRGEARVVGGRWAVTRATVCSDLSALDADCA